MAVVAANARPDRDETDRPPWWTEADQAELAALTWELVDGYFEHKGRCETCKAGYPPCPYLREAIEVVVDWRHRRQLLSRALWLRRQRELLEYGRDVVALNEGSA